ncbi:MAG: polysaccharide deacetylase family protein [Candidatus Vecturithrix sp.]|jgi:peptidoglycan/xylan/chitin deacetylase (PgdA/CDA1 family)|nr:polysaccharide deacetylase family protein [Candidatus Vecturithrix sp.]
MWTLLEKIIRKRAFIDSKLAMVSFTFDDAPFSAFLKGGTILEEFGYRGTYYVSAGIAGESTEVGSLADLETIVEFQKRGHEIANHTYSHINCEHSSPIDMLKNIRRNSNELQAVITRNFSYPYGAANASSRCVARICTSSARGISHGINKGAIDLMNLRASRVYNRLGIDKCLDLISDCAECGGWLIFYTHDVCEKPSDYGCKPEQLVELIKAISCKNLSVMTVREALVAIGSFRIS